MKRTIHLLLFFLISISADAQHAQWFTNLGTLNEAEITCNTFDSEGNLYSAGIYHKANDPVFSQHKSGDLFLIKRNLSGQILWTRYYDGKARIIKMTTDREDNLILTGAVLGKIIFENETLHYTDTIRETSFLLKLDTAGHKQWLVSDSTQGETNAGTSLQCDKDNNIYWVGFKGDISTYLKKVNADGVVLWNKAFDHDVRTFGDVAVYNDEHIYIAGTADANALIDTFGIHIDPNTGYAQVLISMDTAGKVEWVKAKSYITFDLYQSVKVIDDRVYWYYDQASQNMTENKLTIYDTEGQLLHDSQLGSSMFGNHGYYSENISIQQNKKLVVTEKHWDSLFTYIIDSAMNIKRSVMPFSLGVQWNTSSVYNDIIVYSGFFPIDSVIIGDEIIHNAFTGFQSDVFWAAFDMSSTTGVPSREKEQCVIYPNPMNESARVMLPVSLQNKNVVFDLFNIQGQKVRSMSTNGIEISIQKNELASGLYLYRISGNGSMYSGKLVIGDK